ncbi:hydrolase [Actinoplanes sp. NBRC 101535]|uniref:Vgb family protein n=1 Tax=Actinoplanes sp. NBRC 101535 TaxID=3032196 RepID=UPI0024A1F1D2|nr:hydrolase [Actinoplanes sp. NBRC 101535]GLY04491.1 hypothetical protein Acsp01_48700 [Actinoplanes sp. NBRC 101535]
MPAREVTLPSGYTPYAVAGDLWTTILNPPGLLMVLPTERFEPLEGTPMLLAVATDGALWCTRTDDRLVRRDTGGDYTVIELEQGSAPYGIAAAPDGGVWFTAPGRNRIGRATATGGLTLFDLPVPEARAAMLTVDADGRPWTALNGADALACLDDGTMRLVELPGGRAPAAPVGIAAAAGGDQGVWYADIAGGCVGLVDPSHTVRQIVFEDPGC